MPTSSNLRVTCASSSFHRGQRYSPAGVGKGKGKGKGGMGMYGNPMGGMGGPVPQCRHVGAIATRLEAIAIGLEADC